MRGFEFLGKEKVLIIQQRHFNINQRRVKYIYNPLDFVLGIIPLNYMAAIVRAV